MDHGYYRHRWSEDDPSARRESGSEGDASQPRRQNANAARPSSADVPFDYDPVLQRARVRQIVKGLTRSLKATWTGRTRSDDPAHPGEGEAVRHEPFGSFQEVLGEGSRVRYTKSIIAAFMMRSLAVGLGIGLLVTVIGMGGLDIPPAALYAGNAIIAVVAGWGFTRGYLDNRIEHFEKQIIISANQLNNLITNFIRINGDRANQEIGDVKATVAERSDLPSVRNAMVESMVYWRALERMGHYVRHDFDDYLRDCREQRFFSKHRNPRKRQYALIASLVLLLAFGGGVLVNLPYLDDSRSVDSPDVGTMAVWVFGSLLSASALAAGGFVLVAQRVYSRLQHVIGVQFIEGIATHKKASAMKVLGIQSVDEWVSYIIDEEARAHWADWTPDYEEVVEEELSAQGLSHEEIHTKLSADENIYIGADENVRIQVLQSDPILTWKSEIPEIRPR